jgi:putative redox protein
MNMVVKIRFEPDKEILIGETPEGRRITLRILEDMSPMELMLTALGSCAAIDLFKALSLRGVNIQSIEIELSGKPAKEDESNHIGEVLMTYTITAQNVTRKEVEEIVQQSLNRYCSIAIALKRSIDVKLNSVVLRKMKTR